MVTDDKPIMAQQIIGGIVLSIQQQRTFMCGISFYAYGTSEYWYKLLLPQKQENVPRVENYFENTIPTCMS